MTVGELCAVCRNWFLRESVRGRFTVRGGVLGDVPGAVPGQYVRIIGSPADDGVYRWPASGLRDGDFDGAVWLMAVPGEFEALAGEIDAWEKRARDALGKAADRAGDSCRSESFGGYSYQKGSALTSKDTGGGVGWRSTFASKLNMWRKL